MFRRAVATPLRILILAVVLFGLAPPVQAMRCRSHLVQEGDPRFLVLERCGEPFEWEVVGYKLNARGDREYKIEQLIYGPYSGGWYYLVEVVGGKVEKIETFKE